MEDVRKSEVSGEEPFEVCPNCGYQTGFHVLLAREDAGESEPNVRILLKCPSCSTRYDVGWAGTVR
ncbi:MAG: hypothetical protein ACE5JM_02235 [Armatimonadota bacterium]